MSAKGLQLIRRQQPTNALESAVTALLESANLQDAQIAKAEEDALKGQDLTVEEIAQRRSELRRQRELLFREEARAKRISKIKSKTYRKIARKRAAKAGGGELDLEDLRRLDPEKAEEEALKMETARARERATLKHSAKGGRWARAQHGAGETDGKRKEIEDMLSQKERLTRKIQGRDSYASSDDDSEDDGDDDGEDDDVIRGDAFDELKALQEKSRRLEEETAQSKPSGIFGMKFMQRAMAKDKARVDEEEAELRRQLEEYSDEGVGSDGGGDSDRDPEAAQSMRVANNPGRMVFSANANSLKVRICPFVRFRWLIEAVDRKPPTSGPEMCRTGSTVKTTKLPCPNRFRR
jgi:U3 small nucleolar RNA-associated protein 14